MSKNLALLVVFLCLAAMACGEDNSISAVKAGTFSQLPSKNIGVAINDFLNEIQWSSIQGSHHFKLVTVAGQAIKNNQPVIVTIHFWINMRTESVEVKAILMDGEAIPKNQILNTLRQIWMANN